MVAHEIPPNSKNRVRENTETPGGEGRSYVGPDSIDGKLPNYPLVRLELSSGTFIFRLELNT